ncbi:trehalose-6-phosphate synthase, partial [Candidatus Fermentibacterales bacterium]|nr:trehalose-6-phosphate synthase [Candidatus Fermentibacterales bacterium]
MTAAPSEGGFRLEESAGGLATGLAAFHGSGESIWIGWPGVPSDRLEEHCAALDAELLAMDCAGVHLTDSEIRGYYSGYSNTAIWPLFHYFQQYARSDPDEWKAYRAVNRKFADSVAEHAQPGDIVWIHDYHLM